VHWETSTEAVLLYIGRSEFVTAVRESRAKDDGKEAKYLTLNLYILCRCTR